VFYCSVLADVAMLRGVGHALADLAERVAVVGRKLLARWEVLKLSLPFRDWFSRR
jgi:hypothetical protein